MTSPATIQTSLSLEEFWRWLGYHYNCILRAGGPGFLIYDQPDVHWHLSTDPDGVLVVQLLKGKETTAELYLSPTDVLYVASSPDEGDQTLFELFGGPEGDAMPICHFLLSHPYEDEEEGSARPMTH